MTLTLTLKGFDSGVSDADLDRLTDFIDTDHDGYVSREEFMTAVQVTSHTPPYLHRMQSPTDPQPIQTDPQPIRTDPNRRCPRCRWSLPRTTGQRKSSSLLPSQQP